MSARLCAFVLLLTVSLLPAVANAASKLAVFPFDMVLATTEEDFYRGSSGPSADEQRRLGMAQEELTKRLGAAPDKYELVDIGPVAADISAAAPIHACNGCEIKLAQKLNADLVMTSVVDKISETHLSLSIAIIDVRESKIVKRASVLIQGNTDESWLHGVRWVTKNRLLAEAEAK